MATKSARSVRIRGHDYPILPPSIRDPRLHVAAVLLTLQVLGQTVLDFRLSIAQILICITAGALIEFGVGFFKDRVIMWPASGMLTGNSTAFILRVPGTYHGQWWSTHGIAIFVSVVAVSMASKYLIRWKGRHIFNPSNLGLVLAFVTLGPQYTEPQDLWWIPMGPWMAVTYAILIGGGLFIGWELKLLGLELGFMAAFAAFVAFALAPAPGHCMIAAWHAWPMCGQELWRILVTSPELLVFALFMAPDPRTVPDGQVARFVFGMLLALTAVLLIGPTTLEFWTKTAILASLVFACAGRFALARLLAPAEGASGPIASLRRLGVTAPAALGIGLVLTGALPLAARTSVTPAAAAQPGGATSAAAVAPQAWVVPPIPEVTIPAGVKAFDPTLDQATADRWAEDAVLDLVIEAEARRTHDPILAAQGACCYALGAFTGVIKQDAADGRVVETTYSFDRVQLELYLPKYSTQAPRLIGVVLHGTATLITLDASGRMLSKVTQPYAMSWGLGGTYGAHEVIAADYTDLATA